MRHPNEGTLRRLLDDPSGVTDSVRSHVEDCPECLAELAAAQDDAAFASSAMATVPEPDVSAGWQRLSGALPAGVPRGTAPPMPNQRWRSRLRNPVAAAVGVAVLVAGAGAAAATDWFPIFRAEQIAPVALTQADVVELPDLSDYGQMRLVEQPRLREVADAAAAAEATGLSVPDVSDLPGGLTDEPTFRVGDEITAEFTFSVDKAADAAAAAGETLPPVPRGLDGSKFQLVAGPGAAVVWPSEQGLPGLMIARAVAPKAYSSEIAFETVRDYLLSLPGFPEDVAAQLRNFSADGSTLPVPVPAGKVTTSSTEVDGTPATMFALRDGTMAGMVWVDEGVVTVVAGSLSTDEVLAVAHGLRER